ncbi:biosynthetic-type acetolactate synthase large subunit [Solidesulfovibrio sp.]|uniref:biosynthetic-type acetolactate synthase large subunit n=1 Tax=Solidesulfovibrio sp. TaxID=2910990 RepID=UPI000EDC97D8|nr:biosynthetic-type acetolactate synthase large subunit [Solidesulfovibrio sp.]MEA5088472.1 biosynthetic-type acetolactate synthase large subunit [Solidesulfovibrio sp.]HCR12483.1 biosynthetic-type acetolactate synthase large subunit [Desulfovibrio sp.]HML60097.1 biosynthetic-type acetolactate synthase large subunit [Solidesulfovibrio sp.]
MELTGAQILLESLRREDVDVVFGFPGGAVIDIYDQLPNYPLRHVLARHEQGAIHAADGYARASGRVGVCLVTSGPGATNAVTGIATAYMDSVPVVVITGQVPTPLIGNDAFQEVDIVGITRPCTKHNYLVKDVRDLAGVIKEAFYLAATGRPGPVLIDLPKDVQQARCEYKYPKTIKMRSYNPTYTPNPKQVAKVADVLRKAKKPIIYAGGGVIASTAGDDLVWLARSQQIPVTATLMALGCFPANDSLWVGMLGMHGTYAANMAISHADLILAIGTRFDDRVTGKLSEFAKNAKIVHIDIDPTSIQKNVPVHIPVVADCKSFLAALRGHLEAAPAEDAPAPAERHAAWLGTVAAWKTEKPLTYDQNGGAIKPQYVVEVISRLTKGEAVITTEVGQNQMWAAQFYQFLRPRSFISSGGLGTMGFGFPAAIGAQMACPDRLVIDVAGDGSIQMCIQELATAVCYDLPVKIVILNNGYLGMVRQWQELFYKKNYCATCLDVAPDFVKLAEAYGAAGYRVTDPAQVESVLAEAFALPKTVIVDVVIDREENVAPMVPAGKSITEMILV